MIPIISELFGIGRDWLKTRHEVKTAKAKAEAKVIVKAADNLAEWERVQAINSGSSWKDEWFALLLSIPLIFCFIPGYDVYIMEGFDVLKNTPEWYRWLLFLAVGASFGVKTVGGFLKK